MPAMWPLCSGSDPRRGSPPRHGRALAQGDAPSRPSRRQARPELFVAFSMAQEAAPKTGKIEIYTPPYYAACTFGGLLACGLTHAAVTPLDLVKTRRQVDAKLYRSNLQAWSKIYRAEGIRGIFTGWGPTLAGYSAQGAFKYGWYEYFKKTYSDLAGPEAAYKHKTALYLAASASAEFLADLALCPFEAVKVRMQSSIPNPYRGTLDGIRVIVAKEGWSGLYKGIYPLWGRQIPYTMMKFASFETIVDIIYQRLPGQKSDYGKAAQTGVSFGAGYLAGILCAIVSHPADVMVSKLNAQREPGEPFGRAIGRIYKEIGFGGLWNGLPVRILMVGTLTGLQWMIYDYFKIFMGLPTTGGGGAPDGRGDEGVEAHDDKNSFLLASGPGEGPSLSLGLAWLGWVQGGRGWPPRKDRQGGWRQAGEGR